MVLNLYRVCIHVYIVSGNITRLLRFKDRASDREKFIINVRHCRANGFLGELSSSSALVELLEKRRCGFVLVHDLLEIILMGFLLSSKLKILIGDLFAHLSVEETRTIMFLF